MPVSASAAFGASPRDEYTTSATSTAGASPASTDTVVSERAQSCLLPLPKESATAGLRTAGEVEAPFSSELTRSLRTFAEV